MTYFWLMEDQDIILWKDINKLLQGDSTRDVFIWGDRLRNCRSEKKVDQTIFNTLRVTKYEQELHKVPFPDFEFVSIYNGFHSFKIEGHETDYVQIFVDVVLLGEKTFEEVIQKMLSSEHNISFLTKVSSIVNDNAINRTFISIKNAMEAQRRSYIK